jgi:hypothetical protein
MDESNRKRKHRLRVERALRIDQEKIHEAQQLRAQVRMLDKILASLPLERHNELNLNAILSANIMDTTENSGTLREIVDTVPSSRMIPAILIDLYMTSLRDRIYRNEFQHSDTSKTRNPTSSEVLQLLPELDKNSKTSLRVKFDAVLDRGS